MPSRCIRTITLIALIALAKLSFVHAENPRPVPPPGIELPEADRAELENLAKTFGDELSAATRENEANAEFVAELPNVAIYHKAVDWALRYKELFDAKQIPVAKTLIEQGRDRLNDLRAGRKPWDTATGLLVRGYRSTLDDSIQPYGLVTPEDVLRDPKRKRPLHFWLHGRNEKLSELAFIEERQRDRGKFVPGGAIVCHLYGRFCNANKFAGEVDLFEVLADVKQHYAIDEDRIVVRGFSMGGAACWQFATHHPGMWAAAAPGAGFAETAEFFNVFGKGKETPPPWEQTLWRWYDCTTIAGNLANFRVIAYSGENDRQKQAADIMLRYAKAEGVKFPQVIGPKMGHDYHPDSKVEIEKFITGSLEQPRPHYPRKIRFTTYTLRYPGMKWVKLDGLEKHWERADVMAELRDEGTIVVRTKNVSALTLSMPEGPIPLDATRPPLIIADGQELRGPAVVAPWRVHLSKRDGLWTVTSKPAETLPNIRKQYGLSGPIDDAFMSRFVFVRPTGKPLNETVGKWVAAELERAIAAWRRVFRGDVLVVDDTALTREHIETANLILWGDPSSNQWIAKLLPELPIEWNGESVSLGTQRNLPAAHHAPILIYPNPLNSERYVVINSGFTFREAAALNNSDQTPKLPDWAVIDLRTPPGPKWPGLVVDAGFFDESWNPPK